MKKVFFLLIYLFSISFLHAQGNVIDIPNVLPASPEAAQLGQFGDIPINMSTGTTGLSIPLYTITEGAYSLPISLNYFNNGLVIDKIPGSFGLGWSLSAGGMVTRQVRGRPDEQDNGYIGTNQVGSSKVVPFYNNNLPAGQATALIEGAASGILDTQPDKFMVSVGSMNATFYFDELKNDVIKPYKPYKISFINQTDPEDGFTIVDDNGISYRFADKEYSEKVSSHDGTGDAIADLGEYVSGWKLTKITLTDNRTIDFSYSNYIYYQEVVSQSQDIIPPSNAQPLKTRMREYKITSKLLTGISFSLGEVNLTNISQSHTNPVTLNQYLTRTTSLEVKNNHNEVIQQYDFTYDNINKTRKLLSSIEVNNDNSNTYEFEYLGAPSDNIPYYKQDFWGYANENSSPKLVSATDMYEPRKPSFNASKVGVISKITYPTKGTSEFSYEPNTYDPGENGDDLDDYYYSSGNCAILSQGYSVGVGIHNGNYTPNVEVSDSTTFTISSDTYVEFQISVIDNAQLGVSSAGLRRLSGPNGEVACDDTFLVGPCDECTEIRRSWDTGGVNTQLQEKNYISEYNVKLKPGVYELYATAESSFLPPCGGCTGSNPPFNCCQSMAATISMTMSTSSGPVIPRSREAGGVRIAQMKSCPTNNPSDCITKAYVYEDAQGISKGHMFRTRNLFKNTYYSEGTQLLSYGSSSNVPLSAYSGSHLIYKEVIENYTGDGNGNNGSKVYEFNYVTTANAVAPFIPIDNKEYQNGKVLKERTLDSNGIDQRIIETDYSFSENIGTSDRVIGFKSIITAYSAAAGNSYLHATSVFSNDSDVDRVVETKDFNWLGTNSFEVIKSIDYTNPQGHLKSEVVEDSDGRDDKKEYLYPYDLNTGFYSNLNTLNRIASPVQIKTYKKVNAIDVLMSNTKTEFNLWASGTILKPEKQKNAKGGDNLQDRLIYYEYDSDGNPLEVSQVGGMKISYIWGYNKSLPIAKLENLQYSALPPATITSIQNLSNSDDDHCYDSGNCDEKALRTALNNLRSQFPDALITTYTYNPLIGPSSMTDTKGYTSYYKYDDQNRLKYVADQDGNILSETEYNYKN